MLSDAKGVRTAERLVSKPLARFHIGVGVPRRLTRNFDLHFLYFYPRYCMVGNLKVAVEWRKLLELRFVDYGSLPVS